MEAQGQVRLDFFIHQHGTLPNFAGNIKHTPGGGFDEGVGRKALIFKKPEAGFFGEIFGAEFRNGFFRGSCESDFCAKRGEITLEDFRDFQGQFTLLNGNGIFTDGVFPAFDVCPLATDVTGINCDMDAFEGLIHVARQFFHLPWGSPIAFDFFGLSPVGQKMKLIPTAFGVVGLLYNAGAIFENLN